MAHNTLYVILFLLKYNSVGQMVDRHRRIDPREVDTNSLGRIIIVGIYI